jgi:hypothetical protein
MRYSVKRTFVVLCVRKYMHIRLQKRFKIMNRAFSREKARRHSPASSSEHRVCLFSFHAVNHLFQPSLPGQNEIRYPRIAALRS